MFSSVPTSKRIILLNRLSSIQWDNHMWYVILSTGCDNIDACHMTLTCVFKWSEVRL